jgi:WD40 repeat protein
MKRLAALLICLTALTSSLAQDASPIITPENAAALTLLESAGSELPVSVSFSPDGRYILATTTDRTLVYSAEDPDAEPRIFPFNEFTFDRNGNLVIGNERWNLNTGLSFGVPPSLTVVRDAAGGPAVIEVVKPGGGTMRVQTVITEPITRMVVNDAFTVLAVATDGDDQKSIAPTVYLYRTASSRLIAALPQMSSDQVSALFFTLWGDSSVLVAESMDMYNGVEGSIALYDAATGVLLPQFSGHMTAPVTMTQDGAFAYEIEGKIVYGISNKINSFSYDGIPYNGEDIALAISDVGIAILSRERTLRFAPFDIEGELGNFITPKMDLRAFGAPYFLGHHLALTGHGIFYIWDLSSADAKPRLIEIESAPAQAASFPQISPDFTRYSYEADGRIYVRDAVTQELLAGLPDSAIVSPDWSRAAYWDGAVLTVDDFAAEQDYLHEVNPRHLGKVADFENGYAAFIDEALQVVDVDSTDGHADTVTIDGSFDGAYFFHNGACIVTVGSGEDRSPIVTIHSTNHDAACEEATYSLASYIDSAFVTPNGRYLVGYNIVCGSVYWMPETRVFPLKGYVDTGLQTNFSIYACGANSIAFSHDETTVYIANSSPVLRGTKSFSPDKVIGEQDLEALLIYADPVEDSFAIISGVFLSPDEEKIAIYVEDSHVADWVQERYIEIFAVSDLKPGTLRRDVRPLQTIPDATVAYFSPDGRYVVTDQGLYGIESVNQTTAVNGTISAFSPDSQVLATYQDGFVTLWRVSELNANNFPLAQYDIRGVRELAFSQDGTRLYVVRDGEVQAWGVAP